MIKRREWFRRSFLGALGAGVSSTGFTRSAPNPRKLPRDYDASKELARSDWKPVFLDAHQNETLVVLSDLIIPETDTPGAKAALVNRFIDRLLAAETSKTQKQFLASLAFLDGECRRRYGKAFVHLPGETQIEILTLMAYPHRLMNLGGSRSRYRGHEHFAYLKGRISQAYYNSEIGMKELGWDGNPTFGSFDGCTHPDGTHGEV